MSDFEKFVYPKHEMYSALGRYLHIAINTYAGLYVQSYVSQTIYDAVDATHLSNIINTTMYNCAHAPL